MTLGLLAFAAGALWFVIFGRFLADNPLVTPLVERVFFRSTTVQTPPHNPMIVPIDLCWDWSGRTCQMPLVGHQRAMRHVGRSRAQQTIAARRGPKSKNLRGGTGGGIASIAGCGGRI